MCDAYGRVLGATSLSLEPSDAAATRVAVEKCFLVSYTLQVTFAVECRVRKLKASLLTNEQELTKKKGD